MNWTFHLTCIIEKVPIESSKRVKSMSFIAGSIYCLILVKCQSPFLLIMVPLDDGIGKSLKVVMFSFLIPLSTPAEMLVK
jgi:hypothetical protein